MTDRDKLVELITELAEFNRNVEVLQKVVLPKVENATIEAEPVRHGKWERFGNSCRCPECGDIEAFLHNYCPNCGCKMDLK